MNISILGTRGIPAQHGGFETFAQDLALYLTGRGHSVTVYCQGAGGSASLITTWNGIRLISLPGGDGALGTLLFDWRATRHASKSQDTILILGYNTAIFSILHRYRGRVQLMNMDGLEWKREKWDWMHRLWLRINECAGAKLATHLIADHPEIERYHRTHAPASKITMIPYGAECVEWAPVEPVLRLGLGPERYAIVIARPEPDNSILEIVRAFSMRPRSIELVLLGRYSPEVPYQLEVMEAASKQVKFAGAIYDREVVQALRQYALFYIHGHTVGGTNPSLVESLAAGNAIVAKDNRFNKWVAGPGARYFSSIDDLDRIISGLTSAASKVHEMRIASRNRHLEAFQLDSILAMYECTLERITDMNAPRCNDSKDAKEGCRDGTLSS